MKIEIVKPRLALYQGLEVQVLDALDTYALIQRDMKSFVVLAEDLVEPRTQEAEAGFTRLAFAVPAGVLACLVYTLLERVAGKLTF